MVVVLKRRVATVVSAPAGLRSSRQRPWNDTDMGPTESTHDDTMTS